MSMSEPLLPHPNRDESSAAAEPGQDGALVEPSPEPDVLESSSADQDDELPEDAIDEIVAKREEASFRPPTGERLRAEDLDPDDPTGA